MIEKVIRENWELLLIKSGILPRWDIHPRKKPEFLNPT